MMLQRSIARSLVAFYALAFAVAYAGSERPQSMPYPLLPEAVSSFGATVCDEYLYVFGGHAGRLPGSSLDGLSPHFCRINVTKPGAAWESLAMSQTSQSPGLVAWNGNIYRVGGLSFKNKAGDPTQFHSLDTFAKYNPITKTWTNLPPLPKPRSSLDAAVVDGKLYVVGGWNLQEGTASDATWHDCVLAFDLSYEDSAWIPTAKPPFSTRALAAAGLNGKLYVLGGMNSDNKITQAVHVYDTKTDTWSAGPTLAGGDAQSGFAISAFVADGKLYYSGSEGVVYRLSDDGQSWQSVERLLFPRSFHRLVANDGKVIAIAGVARGGGYLANLEVIDVAAPAIRTKSVEWTVDFKGQVKQGQALLLNGSSLFAFGGNRTREPHNFSKESFVDEAYRFDIAAQSVERLDNLPVPTQGAVAQLAGPRIDQSIYVMGGFASPDDKYSSVDTIFQYRLRSKAWTDAVGHLPTTRAMFGSTAYQGDFWLFGGSRVNTPDKGLVAETWRMTPGSEEPPTIVADADIPTSRRSFANTILSDRYYVVGGLGDSQIVDSAFAFDLKSQQWTAIASPKVARVFPNMAASGGKLYLSGGFARVDGHFQPANTVEVYNPTTNDWQTAFESLPFAEHVNAMLEFQDRLLFYGIDRKEDGIAHFAILDPAPQTAGFGKPTNPTEERPESTDLLVRLMRLDKNKDGKLTVDEVGERYRPIIGRADTDKDGFASKSELEAILRSDETTEGRRVRN